MTAAGATPRRSVAVGEVPVGRGELFRAVWVGTIAPEQAPHLAIRAAERADLPCVLIGPVADRDYLEREVRPRLGSAHQLLAALEEDAVHAEVGRSSVALFTPSSDAEADPDLIVEALATGTPVAAFEHPTITELLDLHSGIVVPPGDVDRLGAAALECVLLRREDCRRRAEALARQAQDVTIN